MPDDGTPVLKFTADQGTNRL